MSQSSELPPAARSLWMQETLARESGTGTALLGSRKVDVCVVGGGLTGLWTAIRAKEQDPSLDVAVLEADVCGSGASGVNGGFAMTWWPKVKTLAKVMGTSDALRMAAASEAAVRDIGDFCRRHGIDAAFKPSGWLWAATNTSQMDSWQATLDHLAALGAEPFKEMSAAEVAEMSGSDQHLGGVFEAGVATIQPAGLVRGLRAAAIAAGIHVWEHSPMTGLHRGTEGVTLTSPGGTLLAQRVALATSAWLARFREIRRHLIVLGSDVIATAPVPRLLEGSALPEGLAISDSRRLVHYYRSTDDGRIVFGKGGGRLAFRGRIDREEWSRNSRPADVHAHLTRMYPATANTDITHAWSGPVDYSSDALPFFGRLGGDPRVVYGVGFSGNGVGPSGLGGRIMASLLLGADDEWSNSPMVRKPKMWLPPEPIRYVGGRVVRTALASKEVAEDSGRKPSRVATFLASLDPTSFVG
ncbi:NAD(P)/FAD-dependent oxidoreductase [Blastococcus litoris]|uniref:NAD(P)/FAD-dependent oxidoreductase n=1 Tax=Blastococcus litoris TaxID=2171622 RepID=UPI000E30A857|nr:FAD-binding oxidoreductase [Blastococcus litoris]